MLERLWALLATRGALIAEQDRSEILALVDGIAEPYVGELVTAFADALPAGGIKDVEWGPIRSALLASIPADETATSTQIAALFDRVVALARSAS